MGPIGVDRGVWNNILFDKSRLVRHEWWGPRNLHRCWMNGICQCEVTKTNYGSQWSVCAEGRKCYGLLLIVPIVTYRYSMVLLKKQHAFVILYTSQIHSDFHCHSYYVTCLIENFIGYLQIILKLFSVYLFYGLFLKINNYTNYCIKQKRSNYKIKFSHILSHFTNEMSNCST